MSNEHQHPTFLVALRAEIGSIAIDLEKRLEHRVEQAEQAFSSLGWEMDTLRINLKSADKDSALLQETNASLNARIGELQETNETLKARLNLADIAYRELVNTDNTALAKHVEKIQVLEDALHTMFTPAQLCERVNAVHDELVSKLSHERRELETVQKLLAQARQERDHYAVQVEKLTNERDEARLSRQALMLEHRGVKNLNRAQGDRIAELRAVGPALDILADMVKETQAKLEVAHQQKDELDADYGKLVGEYEDISKHFDLLRNLILDCKLDADDRYGSFGRAMRVDRKEAKMAIHTLVASHPLCVDLQQQVDTLIKRTETEGRRITNAELLHQFPHKAQMVLDAADNCTRHALSSLQYGQTHHCLARLREAVLEYQKFLTKSGRRRDDQG